jgi:hypothetical protein
MSASEIALMPQLACPQCHMTVSVLDGLAAARPCPSCGQVMELAEDETPVEEAEVAEEELAPRFVAVEVSNTAPGRPTVVLPAGEAPEFKPSRAAEGWLTVGHGLTLMRRGALIALVQPIGVGLILLLNRLGVMTFTPATLDAPAGAIAWLAFLLTALPVIAAGIVFILGLLCAYRVPPRTGARPLMLVAAAGTALTMLLIFAASFAWLVATDAREFRVVMVMLGLAVGVGLATEAVFLSGLALIGFFVKRPAVGRVVFAFGIICVGTTVALLSAWVATDRSASLGLLLLAEMCAAGVLVLYLLVLTQAHKAVLTKTAEE